MIDEKILSDIDALKKELYNSNIFKEYFSLKNYLKRELSPQKLTIFVIFRNYLNLNQKEKQLYAQIKNKSKDDPVLSNFFVLKEEIEDLKDEVNKLLSLWFMQS